MTVPEDAVAVGLTAEEYDAYVELLGRRPNALELGLAGALWSEHCSYKSSRETLRWFADASLLGGNAGVAPLDGDWEIAFKVESHNHPSYVEPFHGAATGVGGIIRDILAMGAEPVCLLDSLRFGPGPDGRRVAPRVVEGIGFYGNAVGVPTVGGEFKLAPVYETNPLVNVLCVGVRPKDRPVDARVGRPGVLLVLMGQRTGRDGIHGASFLASRVFSGRGDEAAQRPQVQVGDPFMGKLLIEAVLAAVATGRVEAVQDLGAAGLSSALSEMADQSGLGVRVDLDAVPLRETGMTPYEVMLSESQERMVLAVHPEQHAEVLAAVEPWRVGATVIGEMTTAPDLVIEVEGVEAARVPARVLTRGCPTRPALPRGVFPVAPEPPVAHAGWDDRDLLRVAGHADCQSREDVWTRYDFMVKTSTVAGPGGDAAVLRLRQSDVGLAVTTDGQARWAAVDPYAGGMRAVVEAAMNCAVTGALPLAVSDGLNAGNPGDEAVFRQFSAMVAGIADAAAALGVPVTGGNVSLYNETGTRAIWPTPVIAMVGRHDRPLRPTPSALAESGALLFRIGAAARVEDLAGSVWRLACGDGKVGAMPRPDLGSVRRVVDLLVVAAAEGLVESAHDVSDGGLLLTLVEMVLGGGGGHGGIYLAARPEDPRVFWFAETVGTAVVAVRPASRGRFEALARNQGVAVRLLGATVATPEFVWVEEAGEMPSQVAATEGSHVHRWDLGILQDAVHGREQGEGGAGDVW